MPPEFGGPSAWPTLTAPRDPLIRRSPEADEDSGDFPITN